MKQYNTPLRRARRNARLTQQQLSDMTGINIRQIQRLEYDEASMDNVTAKNLIALADALGVDPHELLEGDYNYVES